MLASLACVDLMVPFAEDTPKVPIKAIAPDVLVKDADYKPNHVVGADFVIARGGKALPIDLVEGCSALAAIRRFESP